jgi:hypothetical protein
MISSRFCSLCTLVLVLLFAGLSLAGSVENMVENPTFADADRAMPPTGWAIYGTLGENTITLVNADDPEERALHIADKVAASGAPGEIGLVQRYIPVLPNQTYRLSAKVKAVPGATTDGAYFQLRFLPSGERIDIPLGNLSTTAFSEIAIEGKSPADTTSVVIYIHTLGLKTPQFLLRDVTLVPIQANDSVTIGFEADQAGVLPERWVWVTQRDGAAAGVDDQVAHSGRQSLWLSGTSAGTVTRVGTNPIRNFIPEVGKRYLVKAWIRSENLAADTWIKIESVNKQRNKVLDAFFLRPMNDTHDWYLVQGVTPPIPDETAELWLNINVSGSGVLWVDDITVEPWTGIDPDVAALNQSLSTLPQTPPLLIDHRAKHPSILVGPDDVDALRALRRTSPYYILISTLLPTAEAAFFTPLPDEPEPYPNGWDVNQWREMRQVATLVSNNLEALGFAYLVTGQERYAQEAKRWIKLVCSWDVNGTTSSTYHDDLGRWLLSSMSLAVDWIYDTLSDDELNEIRPVLLARGRELFRVQVQKLDQDPYNSHAVSSLTYLMRAALVLSDIPEAQQWLDFIARFFKDVYPPWGGDDGGWNEGINYWRFSMELALEAADMLRAAGIADLYEKAWYRNTGYFQMYFQPSGVRYMNVFGDGSFGSGPGTSDYTHSIRLAAALNDPYLKWYAQKQSGSFSSPILAYLFFYRYGDNYRALEQRSPEELPRSRAFYDVGWVAMHSNLANAADDVSLYFKSSPLGSASHSHGEQNSFTLTAWNTPLLISSGYYDYYGSPHHNQFTRQTRSKNTILVDGEGQQFNSIEAAGKISEFFTGPGYDFSVGQAAQAYSGRLDEFSREILYCVPDYFVVIDRLKAPKPVHYNWLLHTLAPPSLDEESQTLNLRHENVGLQVRFLQPTQLQSEITDRPLTSGDALTVFKANEVPPETAQPPQYHFAATTPEAATDEFFVTVLHPYRQSEPDLQFSGSYAGEAYQILATGTDRRDVTLLSLTDRATNLHGAGVAAQARMVSVSRQGGRLAKLLFKEGQEVTLADGGVLKTSHPVTMSIEYTSERVEMVAQIGQETSITLPMPQRPAHVLINGVNHVDYNWQSEQLTLLLPAGRAIVQVGL